MEVLRREIANGYCVFDLETTGLDSRRDLIIEIAAMKWLSDGSQRAPQTKEWLVNIDRPLPEFITGLTGLTDDKLMRFGHPLGIVLTQFAEFADGLPLVGHNVFRFDRPFLLAASDQAYPNFASVLQRHRFIDTAALFKGFAMGMHPDEDESHADWAMRVLNTAVKGLKYNLDAACHEFQVGNRDRTEHRAMPDVERTQALFEKLMDAWDGLEDATGEMFPEQPTKQDEIMVRW